MAQSPEKQAAALRSLSAFTYQASSCQVTTSPSLGRRQSKDDKIELAKAAMTQAVPAINVLATARAPSSSLQRLARNALVQNGPVVPAAQQPAKEEDHVEIGTVVAAEEQFSHIREGWKSRGSEDWAVPDTDEESSEEFVDAPEEMGRCRKLDLAAFTFTGQ
jgi:hypothetical protein